MAKDTDRFQRIYRQGMATVMEIWVDRETGVNLPLSQRGILRRTLPLLDREGKPVITPVSR